MDAYEARQNWIDEMLDRALAEGFSGNGSINMVFSQIEGTQYAPDFWENDDKGWSDWD